ncbi:MAG TPA: AraC family transcriptional regulator [Rariglobus sp.]|jgi:AraC-like DNA-binding protein/quercetin dioxygenase-like cupin family protein|nr:AraC family transcriptional regulator [Rariglobus sp.]
MLERPVYSDSFHETVVIGHKTQESVKALQPELHERGIVSSGITRARAPYSVVRRHFPEGHLIATLDGEGMLWHDGDWKKCRAGDVFISPPGSSESFHAIRGKEWVFCWLHTTPAFFDGYTEAKPRLIQADPRLFHLALEGYLHVGRSQPNPAALHVWADLVKTHGQQFIQPEHSKVRLWKLWAAVIKEPARPWDVSSLSNLAGLSREQLRHHSVRETGRSPMQQVAYLRVQRAIEILQTTGAKLDVIAELVGYSSPFALSHVFLKTTGQRPSAYRPNRS